MLAVAVLRRPAEDRDDDLGTEPPDDADHILEHGVLRPVLPGLLHGLGVAEVVGPGEVLPGAIEPPRGEQLLGPDQTQRLAQLGSDQVLAPFAAVERQVRRLGAHPPHQDGEQLGILVVRMGADHQHPLVVTQHPQLVVQRHDAAGGGRLELRAERDAARERSPARRSEKSCAE